MKRTLLFFLATNAFAAHPPLKICHVSASLGKVLPRAQDARLQHAGFRLAIDQFQARTGHAVTFVPYSAAHSITQAVQWADESGCHVTVGLVSSREALLAAPLLKEKGIPGFSSTATADELSQWFPYVMSASTSQQSWVTAAAQHVRKSGFARILILTKASDVYSLSFTNKLKQQMPQAQVISLDLQNRIPASQLAALEPGVKTAFLFTTYPILSIPTLQQLAALGSAQAKRHWVIFGTHSWLEPHTFFSRQDLFAALPPAKVFSPWNRREKSPTYFQFKKAFQMAFGTLPDHDSAYDYDTTALILGCHAEQPTVTATVQAARSQLLSCLKRKRQFAGVTGTYRFSGTHSHPDRSEYLFAFDLEGMLPFE